MTEAGIYSLSPATKELLKNLKDQITVKIIFSKDIPYPYNTNIRYALDLLKDYKRISSGKIILDSAPMENEDALREAASIYGIPPVQLNAIENDQIQIKRVYMGIAFVHAEQIETIPVIDDISNLEYQISSVIKSLLRKDKKRIALITGHGERPLNRLKEALKESYEIKTVHLKDEDIDADIALIAGPKNTLSDSELLKVDQYILKGGKVLFLIDRIDANPQYGFGKKVDTGIEKLLAHYGVTIEPELIYDLSAGMINVSQRRGGFIFTTVVPYPFFPRILSLNREHIITRGIETITLGYASPITVNKREGIETTVLARTSKRTGILEAPYYVSFERRFTAKDFNKEPQTVAVILSGRFKTQYPDKKDILKEGESRIVIISDSEFVSDEFIDAPGNGQFIMNAIDWLAEDDSLISIRSKRVESRPIREMSTSLQKVIRYSIVIIPPFISVLTGIISWRIKRSRRVNLS
jgi:gliding-associated putative ABC transporter substrate-binding component GldG